MIQRVLIWGMLLFALAQPLAAQTTADFECQFGYPQPGVLQIDVYVDKQLFGTIKNGHFWIPSKRWLIAVPMASVQKECMGNIDSGLFNFNLPFFGARAVGSDTSIASAEAVGDDLNGDGLFDAIYVNFQDRVFVHVGQANGSRQVTGNYLTGTNPEAAILGDFNKDQKLDLAVANAGAGVNPGNIAILNGNGNATFAAARTFPAGTRPTSLFAADLNSDGNLDLAVGQSGGASILLGNGDGTFQAAVSYTAGTNPTSILATDFNGDQRLDLVVANKDSSNLSVLLGTGTGTFGAATQVAVPGSPDYLGSGDFNADGKADLIVSMSNVDTFLVLLGNGSGGFLINQRITSGRAARYFLLEDLNQDGSVEILSGSPTSLYVYRGNAEGTFAGPPNYAVGIGATGVTVADFDGDTKLDLAVSNQSSLSILTGRGDGAFNAAVTNPLTGRLAGIASGDFNQDGRVDLAAVDSQNASVKILNGVGNGTFGAPLSLSVGPSPRDVRAADLNGDGRLDLMVPYEGTSQGVGGVSVLRGTAGGGFLGAVNVAAGARSAYAAAADFNGDTRMDLAVLNIGRFPETSSVSVLMGTGDATYAPPVTLAFGALASSLSVGDVNGDLRPDLLVGGEGQTLGQFVVAVFLGNANGSFQTPKLTPTSYGPGPVAVTDISGDGVVDLVVTHCCGSVDMTYLIGNGDGFFQPEVHFAGGADTVALAIADLNGDNKKDVVTLGQSFTGSVNGTATVLLNHFPKLLSVEAGGFTFGPVAPDSIVAAFGTNLASGTFVAPSGEPATNLGGTTVTIRDSTGVDRAAQMFFASPGQVNYLVPAEVKLGGARVTIARTGATTVGGLYLTKTSPGVFALNGQQLAAALVLRANASGQSIEQVFSVDSSNAVVSAPIDLGPATDQVFLLLYGTGLRGNAGLSSVRATVAGVNAAVSYAGSHCCFVGLDQVNLLLPRNLIGRGAVTLNLTVDGLSANPVTLRIR